MFITTFYYRAGNNGTWAERYGPATANMKCTVDPNYRCGGPLINSLYQIEHSLLRFPSSQPTIKSPAIVTNVPTVQSTQTTTPSPEPSSQPSIEPTTVQPTVEPTNVPSTITPTFAPTFAPTTEPSTITPTFVPSFSPTTEPSKKTDIPTNEPISTPTIAPSVIETDTYVPTVDKSIRPVLIYLGDYNDSPSTNRPRALQKRFPGVGYTPDSCHTLALANNYRVFGLQYGGECW